LIRWEGEKAIVPLKKLSIEQRIKRFTPYVGSDVPMKKQKMMREEFKKEYLEIDQERQRINGNK
jgi:hypothetical protein